MLNPDEVKMIHEELHRRKTEELATWTDEQLRTELVQIEAEEWNEHYRRMAIVDRHMAGEQARPSMWRRLFGLTPYGRMGR